MKPIGGRSLRIGYHLGTFLVYDVREDGSRVEYDHYATIAQALHAWPLATLDTMARAKQIAMRLTVPQRHLLGVIASQAGGISRDGLQARYTTQWGRAYPHAVLKRLFADQLVEQLPSDLLLHRAPLTLTALGIACMERLHG